MHLQAEFNVSGTYFVDKCDWESFTYTNYIQSVIYAYGPFGFRKSSIISGFVSPETDVNHQPLQLISYSE